MRPSRVSARFVPPIVPLVALLLGLSLSAGCGLFDPETPEPPGTGNLISLPDLTQDPDSALTSIELGVENRNLNLYIHGVAESTTTDGPDFHAFFDIQDTLDFFSDTGSHAPADWGSQDEKTFFNVLIRQPLTYEMVLVPDGTNRDSRGSTVTLFFRRYRIYAGGAPVAFGIADLELRRVGISGEWKIVLWTDHRDSETDSTTVPTMGKQRLSSIFIR